MAHPFKREKWINKKWGHPLGVSSQKRAGDGPKWWCHENDSSAARRVRANAGAARVGQARRGFPLKNTAMKPLVAKQIVVINDPKALALIGSNIIYYNIYILFEIVYNFFRLFHFNFRCHYTTRLKMSLAPHASH